MLGHEGDSASDVVVPRYTYTMDGEHGILVRVNPEALAAFGPDLLQLGDVRTPSRPVDVLAVVFDLEGFTHFTRQIDPQLTVPAFLSSFLQWLFDAVRAQLVQREASSTLWAELPFFSKFMGDGVLFLWRIDLDQIVGMDRRLSSERLQASVQEFVCNIIASMLEVARAYQTFLGEIGARYVDPPRRLRCGIARGTVIPIGAGTDFVGPCINIASRLQKLHRLSFACSARGIEREGFNPNYGSEFHKLRTEIRGIGERELVYVLRREFDALPETERDAFLEP